MLDAEGNLVVDQVLHGFDETVKQQIRDYMNPRSIEPVPDKPPLENNTICWHFIQLPGWFRLLYGSKNSDTENEKRERPAGSLPVTGFASFRNMITELNIAELTGKVNPVKPYR